MSSRWIIAGLVLLIAAGLRVAAGRGDMWIDEIASLMWAEGSGWSPFGVVRFTNDNNHLLNTAYLALVGPNRSPLLYRGLSLVSGLALVVVLARTAAVRGRAAGMIVLLLAAFSFPLIVFASEARGYSLAALCAVLAFRVLRDDPEVRPGTPLKFGLLVVAGFLAHLTMGYVYLALGAWSAIRLLQREALGRSLLRLIRLHALPIVGLALLTPWLFDMTIMGGPPTTAVEAAVFALGEWLGIPAAAGGGIVAAPMLIGCLGFCIWASRGGDSGECQFLIALAASMVTVTAAANPPFVLPRYFLLGLPFALLAVGYVLAAIWARGYAGRVVVALVMTLYLGGQAAAVVPLLRDGRGQYTAAVAYMARHTPEREIRVRGAHDWQIGNVLRYYAHAAGTDREMTYVPGSDTTTIATWFIRVPGLHLPPPTTYARDTLFPSVGGDPWEIYRFVE